jgi:aspartate ammonia-lyase
LKKKGKSMSRVEEDPLGKKEIPDEAYYGIQTLRAVENFPVSGIKAHPSLIRAYVMIKKAACLTNMELGVLDREKGEAIVKACDEILGGKFLDQFVVDVYQAGAGTSFNMNVNEVIANRALEILGEEKGNYKVIGPNDHVNMAQSSNDTFPTAMYISVLFRINELLPILESLANAFEEKGREFSKIMKSGRTHLQDAVPITLGQEFKAYASAIRRCARRIRKRSKGLGEIALGGTAVGTGLNSHPSYRKIVIEKLREITGLDLRPARDPREGLQSFSSIVGVSSGLKELALELIRIANDLRLLSSGPITGLGEIRLPAVQPGSSIMPGKVNPVMAECLNMVAFQVVGNDLTVTLAAQAGQIDLNVFAPVINHNIHQSIDILANYLPVFEEKCVRGITADEERCKGYLEKNPALATVLTPYIGYMKAAEVAKEALRRGKPVEDIVVEKRLMSREEVRKIFKEKLGGPLE